MLVIVLVKKSHLIQDFKTLFSFIKTIKKNEVKKMKAISFTRIDLARLDHREKFLS